MNRIMAAIAAFFVALSPLIASASSVSVNAALPKGASPAKDAPVDLSPTSIARMMNSVGAPQVIALDRVQHLTGLNPPSTWMNQEQRDVRLGFGAFMWNLLCGQNASTCPGQYANLSVVPVTGLYVAVAPTVTNTVGTLYQFKQEETSGFGGYPSGVGTYLAADPTQVMLQGTITTNTTNIGPLTAGTSSGQSVDNLIECQVNTIDTTPQTVNIVSPGGSVTATSANRDRKDTLSCQNKPGTSATTGAQTVPTTDSGYIAIGYVAVAYGTVTVTSGMITPILTSQFAPGSTVLNTSGQTLGVTSHTVFITVTTSASPTTCGPMVGYYCATATLTGGAVFTSATSFTCGPGFTVNPINGFTGYTGVYNYILAASTNELAAWNSGSTIYIGGTAGVFASNTFTLACTGY